MTRCDHNAAEIALNSASLKALIFDMDGTIIDNMMVHHRAWQQLLGELGYSWSLEEIKARVWGKNEEIFERLFPGKFSQEQVAELTERKERRYVEIYRPDISMLAGLQRFLEDARDRGVKLGIATAAPRICVDFVREALSLENYFDTIVDAQQVLRGKPHPEGFLRAAECLGVSPEECVVFEDAPVGVQAAQAAGMDTYVVLTTHTQDEFSRFTNVRGFLSDFQSVVIR